ncbi:MAG: hypothetical protein KDB61_07320, partial [Planctomycetes bacterium]|nr:hypothetical protein [Planctomycetota bacterium]
MDSKQWMRVRELFESALDQPEAEQVPFVENSSEPAEIIAEAKALLESSRHNLDAFEPPTPALNFGPGPEPLDISKGTRIGQYTVEARIGTGGMADVYVATQ